MRPVKIADAAAAAARSPEWREARRRGVGSSEIASILGLAPSEWSSAFALWWSKREGWTDDDTTRLRAGRLLEPVVVELWRDRYGDMWDVWPGGLYRHPHLPWMLATPDRNLVRRDAQHRACCPVGQTVVEDDGVEHPAECVCDPSDADAPDELLELKTSATRDGWGDEGTDAIPSYYLAQARWQATVMDVPRVRVACMFLPSCEVREYIVERHEGDEAMMKAAARTFLDLLERGTPPPPDWTASTKRALHRLHPKVEDIEAVIPKGLADEYARAVRAYRKAERRREAAGNEILARIGDARYAVTRDGRRVATRSVYEQARIDVRRLRVERPDIVAEYVRPVTTHRLTPAREDDRAAATAAADTTDPRRDQ